MSLDVFLNTLNSLEGTFGQIRNQLKQGNKLGDIQKDSEADKILEDLGCVEVITRQEAGDNFYAKMARQIDSKFSQILPSTGGAMSLIDLYLYYNRLRGSDLITTHDLLKAMRELNSMRGKTEMVEVKGGLKFL